MSRAPSWLKGVMTAAEEPTSMRLAHAPREELPSDDPRVRLVTAHTAIIAIDEKLRWHTEETSRLVAERRAAQDDIAEVLANIGMTATVAG